MADIRKGRGDAGDPDRQTGTAHPRAEHPLRDEADYARMILKHRRLRDRVLAYDIFSEPAWDVLLDLFVCEVDGIRVSKSSLMIAAAVPQSTAMRWITNLVAEGILEVAQDQSDGRRAFVWLSREVFAEMAILLKAFRADDLSDRGRTDGA